MRSSDGELAKFVERYRLARETAIKELPARGTSGLELEWNMVDEDFRPLQTVGSGPDERSFVEVFRGDFTPEWLQAYTQLEVFHWMIEWVTSPYYSPTLTVYESRLLEALMMNLMRKAGRSFEQRLYQIHGNSLWCVEVDHSTIPGGWGLAKRRYLQKCVDLYGPSLASAGLHSNVSLPEPLLSWDFMHLPDNQRIHHHLDEYKNEIYIESTRLMRAFACLFIATSASTPLRAEIRDGKQIVLLTENDSNRNLTFPYPEAIDVPNLYRSHQDYIQISNELVQSGVRFGNNNWTPVRARSFAEPVERLIDITSEQLHEIYRRGLYVSGNVMSFDKMVQDLEVQNLLARIDIPMARVEIRTDDGGHPLLLDVANLAFKELLLIKCYADQTYARAFRYDKEDLQRARRNEVAAAQDGLQAALEHPLTGKPVQCRDFLKCTMEELRPAAEGLEMWDLLEPLRAMAEGAPNTATVMREQIRSQINDDRIVPLELLRNVSQQREEQVAEDVERIANELVGLGPEGAKLQELYWRARNDSRLDPAAPIRFSASAGSILQAAHPDKTTEIVHLAQHLIRIPTVSNVPPERQRLQALDRCATFVSDFLGNAGLEVVVYEKGRFPAILAHFPGMIKAPVMLCGHFDVVEPEPDESQFDPRIEGDYLLGRGAADMKTVVATFLVWMKDAAQRGFPYPAINLLLVGNEEIGETEATGTPHVLADLAERHSYQPKLLIAGERTGENGDELFGKICLQNRGLIRMEIIARGRKSHTGIAANEKGVSQALFEARQALFRICQEHMTHEGEDGWRSQLKFPYTHFGERGIYNVAADRGILGVEIRIIPEDPAREILEAIRAHCRSAGLEMSLVASEAGIQCSENNIYFQKLSESAQAVSGQAPELGRKLPGTSARFASDGQGIVWGQSGIGPHTADERHYLPSIKPYYDVLAELGLRMSA